MPSSNYEEMTIAELEMEKLNIDRIIKQKKKTAKTDFVKQCRELAKSQGLNFDELMGKKISTSKANGVKSEPKYRNDSDPSQTWSGKGRKPNWLIKAIEQGKV